MEPGEGLGEAKWNVAKRLNVLNGSFLNTVTSDVIVMLYAGTRERKEGRCRTLIWRLE